MTNIEMIRINLAREGIDLQRGECRNVVNHWALEDMTGSDPCDRSLALLTAAMTSL